jgi:LPXTG-motif cell wall-anchored protein
MKEFGGIMGVIQVGMIVSGTGAPFMAGRLHDATGSFNSTFLVIAGIFVIGIAALLFARPVEAGTNPEEQVDPA